MEAIKKLLRPGADEDDKTLYGQQTTTNTTDERHQKSGLTGEGSHLAGSQAQPNLPGQDPSSVPASTTHNTGGEISGQGSHLSGATGTTGLGQQQSTGLGHGSTDPGATRHIGGGGLGHGQHERSDPANKDLTALGGSSGLGGDHSKSTTQGPHSSSMMNKIDPRVDSDQSRNTRTSDQTGNYVDPASGTTDLNQRTHGGSTDTSRGNTSLPGYGIVQGQTTTGAHSSDMLNKADPRVDSDFSRTRRSADESGNFGGAGAGMATTGHREHEHSTGNSQGNPILGQSTQSQSTSGPHSSNLMNKLDPRVDSDNSKSINSGAGYTSTTGGSHHTGPIGSAVPGPHHTMAANLLDPNLNNTTTRGHEDAIHHTEKQGGGAEEADNDHRDAGKKAAVAGAVGLGAIGMGSDSHQSRFTERGADGSAGGHTSMMPGAYPPDSASFTGGDFQPGTQTTSSISDRTRATNDPTASSSDREHHHGRDAALVGGAAGLGGAAYGASKHSDKSAEPVHNSEMLNRVDPRVTTDNSGTAYGTNPQDRSHGIMTGNTTSHQTSQTAPHSGTTDNARDQQQHHGRDAALGAGAAGAAYGLGRQHESHPQGVSTTTTTTTSTSTSTAGPHSSDMLNRADPRVDSDRSKEQSRDHNYGRDTALAGGAGAAALGTHQHGDRTSTAGPHSSDMLNRADPRVDSDRSKEQSKDHNYGRDAAVAGGVGAAAVGAYQLSDRDEKDLKQAEKDRKHAEKEQQHAQKQHDKAVHDHDKHEKDLAHKQKEHDKDLAHKQKEHEKDLAHKQKEHDKAVAAAEKERHHREKEHEKQLRDNDKRDTKDEKHAEKHAEKEHKGLFSFLHRDKNKKYTQEEEDDFARQERDHNSSTSNTIVGSAQIGGSSLGDKLHGTARNRGIIGSSGFPEGEAPADTINHVTGEPLPASHSQASDEAQRKPSLADKLHGERNRGAPSAFPHGGGPNVDVNQHTGEPMIGQNVPSHQTAPLTGPSSSTQHTTAHSNVHDDDQTHSYSRTGALGEDKQSANEYNSSRSKQGDILSPTTASYTHSGTGASNTHHSSHAQASDTDAAPRHLTSEQKTDGSGDGVLDADSGVKTAQGVQTGESHGVGVASGSDGRNRLHKDPPADRY